MNQRINVLEQLKKEHIPYEIQEHPAVFTIEESSFLIEEARGEIAKNLFLKDAKGKQHYLIVMCHDKRVDLKELRVSLGSTALSFGSEERLMKYLGLRKGSVTPMGIINDKDHHVIVVFDQDLKEKSLIGVHPNDNTATLWLTLQDLENFIATLENKIRYIVL